MSAQRNPQAHPSVITDGDLRDNIKATRARGASEGEIISLIQKYGSGDEPCNIPSTKREEFIDALGKIGCPAHFFPIAERLVQIGSGHGGLFIVCGFGEDPETDAELPSQILHLPNKGEPAFMYRQFGSAVRRLGKKSGLNTYVMPSLVRDGLVEGFRGKESDVIAVLAIVVDFDGKHDPATRRERLPVYPHAEVETSPGNFQCWYFLDKPYTVTEAKPVIAALVEKAGADPGCKSADHPFRIPGTLNWPNAKKRARGRSATPVIAQLTDPPEECLGDRISLYDLKAAILARWPNAFDEQQARALAATEFDWDQRRSPLKPMSETKIINALNNSTYANDRSSGAWAFIKKAIRHGYTPNEIVNMMVGHAGTSCMGHYSGDQVEDRVRADVQRAFIKVEPTKPLSTLSEKANIGALDSAGVFAANEMSADVWHAELNKLFAVTKYGGQIVVAQISDDKLEFMKVDDFHRMLANKFIKVETAKDETKRIPVSKSWFTWDGRRQYLSPGVVFEPGAKDRPGALNLWRGFGIKPKRGEWPCMRDHILNVVCSGNQQHFDYLMKWMAHGVQHPDQPIGVAVALRGAQGAGKGILFRTYGSFFGQHFVHLTQGGQLTGRFNASLGTACAVFLDEALWAGDRQGEGTLKALVTEPTFQLERKFCDPITVPNRLRIMIASNSDWFVPVGVGDRRFFVLDVADHSTRRSWIRR